MSVPEGLWPPTVQQKHNVSRACHLKFLSGRTKNSEKETGASVSNNIFYLSHSIQGIIIRDAINIKSINEILHILFCIRDEK